MDEAENLFIFNLNPQPNKPRWLGATRVRAEAGRLDPVPFTWQWADKTPFDFFDYVTLRPGTCDTRDVAYQCIFPQNAPAGPDPNDLQGRENCLSMGHESATLAANWNDLDCFKQYVGKWVGGR